MAILDQITQMKKDGLSDQDIISNLQSQGINPGEIMGALDKAKIKEAVAGEDGAPPEAPEPYTPQSAGQENYAPQTQEMPYNTQQGQMDAPQEYAPQEGYEEQNYSSGNTDSGTMIEIAEQVFEEKSNKITKELDSFKEFSTLAGSKITNFEDRIKRMEKIIDNLQIKILEKIGSYGQGINSIKKEMSMMEDSFTKMVPELAKKQTSKKVTKKKVSKKK